MRSFVFLFQLFCVASAAAQPYAYVLGQRDDPPGGANSGVQVVSVVNTSTNAIVQSIPVGVGCICINPNSIAISPDGARVYVTNELDDTVSVISTASNTVIATIPLGSGAQPTAVVVSPTSNRLYVLKGEGTT